MRHWLWQRPWRGPLHRQKGLSTKKLYFSTCEVRLSLLWQHWWANRVPPTFKLSFECQNTIVPDVHCQQWDCSQGLAEQFSGNFPADSFYSPSLIRKGSNFCVFLPENCDSVCFSSAHHLQVTLPDHEWLSDLSLSHDLSLGNLMVLSSGQIVQQRRQQKQCYYPGTFTLLFCLISDCGKPFTLHMAFVTRDLLFGLSWYSSHSDLTSQYAT